jgi:hypothetical protein
MILHVLLSAAPAEAQGDPSDEAAREEALFGPAPADDDDADDADDADDDADNESAREAELFGEAPPPHPRDDAPGAPVSRDDELLGGAPADAEDDIARRLAALDQRLVIGGRLWLQTVAMVPEGAEGPGDVPLSAPNRLDLFADARPNDRVRAFASGRLQHDWTVRSGDTDLTGQPARPDVVILDQLWTKFDVGRRVFVTAGRQRIRWGAGRFWNPTDFLNQQRLDPLAVLDLRTGVDLLKVHVPFERAGANVYAVANLADARTADEVGGALRAEWAFGQTELTASGAVRKDQPARLGGDLSSGVGPFDVRLEVSAQDGALQPPPRDPADPLTPLLELLPAPRPPGGWALQVVAGVDLTLKLGPEDSLVVGVEGFHNAFGTDRVGTYPRMFLEGTYVPLYVGRDYAAAYALLQGPGRGRWNDQTFLVSGIANLSDRSVVVRADWRGQVLTWLQPLVYVQVHGGDNGELHYRFEVPPIPGFLPDGLVVPAPLVDLGLGLIVRF